MVSARLSHALDAGLTLPDTGCLLVIGPPADAELPVDPARCDLIVTDKPTHDALVRRGLAPQLAPSRRYTAAHVTLPRTRDLAEARVAQACALTDGVVMVDGTKTDGIEPLLKALRTRVTLDGVMSKAHGKIAWFISPGPMPDWAHGPRTLPDGRLTAPGVFSADGPDPASVALGDALPERLGATVADLGAGWGGLAPAILARQGVEILHLVEADHSALDCARANVADPRAAFHWADATAWAPPGPLDSVVMNPPFHQGRRADPSLGQAFIAAAARMLSPSGRLFMVANRHLPYESALRDAFAQVDDLGGDTRFKLIAAARPRRARR